MMIKMDTKSSLLRVEHLSIDFKTEYDTVHAVREVSLSLNKGETLAIVGESGCGKSVFCRSIPQILPASGKIVSGEIFFQGQDLTKISKKELQSIRGEEIGFIWQDPLNFFTPTVPLGKQVMESLLAHRKCSKKEAKEKAVSLLEQMGISHAEERFLAYPHEFSGGMLQRAAIAAAMICDPALLIADEPTTALDVTVQKQILSLLAQIQKEKKMAMLLVTHDLSVAAAIADRIAVMYAGKIVEIGTAKEIFEDPRHPYTWGLMHSIPEAWEEGEPYSIPGAPPTLSQLPKGDAFAPRNPYALAIDWEEEPPLFEVTPTHFAATWLLHPDAPKVEPPIRLKAGDKI